MNISTLIPQPPCFETFKRKTKCYVPENPGCYVLTTFSRVVLYIGLTTNLRKRMNCHLDSATKTGTTPLGKVALFFWIEAEEISKIERTWMNIHIQHEGALPVLNILYSPVTT